MADVQHALFGAVPEGAAYTPCDPLTMRRLRDLAGRAARVSRQALADGADRQRVRERFGRVVDELHARFARELSAWIPEGHPH